VGAGEVRVQFDSAPELAIGIGDIQKPPEFGERQGGMRLGQVWV